MTIETGPYLFQYVYNPKSMLVVYQTQFPYTNHVLVNSTHSYLIDNGVCYLALCERSFSKRLVFNYLEDLQNEFVRQYGSKINMPTRPYYFIEFGSSCNFIVSNVYVCWAMQHTDTRLFWMNRQLLVSLNAFYSRRQFHSTSQTFHCRSSSSAKLYQTEYGTARCAEDNGAEHWRRVTTRSCYFR